MSLSISSSLIQRTDHALEKEEAIRQAGQLLVDQGYIQPAYLQSMLAREKAANTFLANGVAIPHGLGQDRDLILKTGIAVLQAPAGVRWNETQTAHLVVAIAAKSQEHIEVLRRLTRILGDAPLLHRLISTSDPEDIVSALTSERFLENKTDEALVSSADFALGFEWTVAYPSGLHARPASEWIEVLKPYEVELRLRKGTETADARSLISLLQLGLAYGDRVFVSAQGPQAKEALEQLQFTMNSLIQREEEQSRHQQREIKTQEPSKKVFFRADDWQPRDPVQIVEGISASPGLVIGFIQKLASSTLEVKDESLPRKDLLKEVARFEKARDEAQREIEGVVHETATKIGTAEAQIFKAQEEILKDPSLLQSLARKLMDGHGLAWSWQQIIQEQAAKLEALGQPLLAARAMDLRDVGMRVLRILTAGKIETSAPVFGTKDVLLVARELTPSQTASMDPHYVKGFCTALGGPTSHTAILARTLGLPAIVGAGETLLQIPEGQSAVLDGDHGRLYLNLSDKDLEEARHWIDSRKAQAEQESQVRALPAQTADGWRIEVAANVNNVQQLPAALSAGAEGVGLMRTEFLFLERKAAPTEEEQFEIYASIVEAMEGKSVIIRTLDIGGDKQVPYLHLPHEANPFLGVRGARLCLRRPDLFEPQLRALYRVAARVGPLSIMFPMITTVEEVKELHRICERIRLSLAAPVVPLGIMVEMPSVAVMAEKFARHVDFFSIGTNDLTQYTLAIDREHPELASLADSLHPAVLRLIEKTVEGARAHNKWVGVCGGLAGQPLGALILAGLGVQEISMSAADISRVKAELRRRTREDVIHLARMALACETLEEVKALEVL